MPYTTVTSPYPTALCHHYHFPPCSQCPATLASLLLKFLGFAPSSGPLRLLFPSARNAPQPQTSFSPFPHITFLVIASSLNAIKISSFSLNRFIFPMYTSFNAFNLPCHKNRNRSKQGLLTSNSKLAISHNFFPNCRSYLPGEL